MTGVVLACHLRIPIVITSLDPAHNVSGKTETVVVNAHGCGIVLSKRLEKGTLFWEVENPPAGLAEQT